jgi:hypothetical protein
MRISVLAAALFGRHQLKRRSIVHEGWNTHAVRIAFR